MALSFGLHVAPLGTASDEISGLNFSDILGASLVTFERHIPVDAEQVEELDPRGIYIKYQTLDPVTKQPAPLVIPGEFSLDAYLPFDGSYQIPMQQEDSPDEVIEEDTASSTQGRRKIRLFSSVKGDPILLRAPTTGSPEAYFSPRRNEGSNWAEMRPGQASRQRPVHANHTLCSFTRAAGRDKFTSPRLAELDSILKACQGAKDGSKPASKRPAPTTVKFGYCRKQALALSARVAASLVSGIDNTAAVVEATPLEDAPPQPRRSLAVSQRRSLAVGRESDTPLEGAGHGTSEDDETKVSVAGKLTADLFARQTSWVSATEEDDQALNGSLASYEHVQQSRPKKKTEPKDLRLRLVDPHLSESAVSSAVPKQRLYSNWPEALKKQVARNYYGLRSEHLPREDAQVAKSERKTTPRMDTASSATDAIATEESQYSSKSVRIQQGIGISGHTSKTAFRPSTPIREKDSSSASSATSVKIPRPSPRAAWNPRPGFNSHPSSRPVHGLEIRISGKERVVVGRFSNTKPSREESASRPTTFTCHNFYTKR